MSAPRLQSDDGAARTNGSRQRARGGKGAGASRDKESTTPGRKPAARSDGPREVSSFPVVGIGASAGGLEAFTELLHHLPSETGMAFVLVQHLDPTHESILTELLSKTTKLSVLEARNKMPLKPDHVYVIPPNTKMTMRRGILRLVTGKREVGAHL